MAPLASSHLDSRAAGFAVDVRNKDSRDPLFFKVSQRVIHHGMPLSNWVDAAGGCLLPSVVAEEFGRLPPIGDRCSLNEAPL